MMGAMSMWHWMLLLGVAALLFGGGGKISAIMGDVAKGVKSFKKGLADDEVPADAGKALSHDAVVTKASDVRTAEKA
jgi:sec-independent protein translocase protein TatA